MNARVASPPQLPAASPEHAPPRLLEQTGDLILFAGKVLRALPRTVRLYPAEVMRQAGDLIRSNLIIILFMMSMLAALVAVTGSFLFEGIGLESYVGVMPSVAVMRGVGEIVFGWILATKAGCGIVAELGAMRISEEIDAMEVMGVRSISYLVGTRLVAALLVVPPLFLAGLGLNFLVGKVFFVDVLGTVSSGGYSDVLFLVQGPRDLGIALLWASILGFLVILVSCYYGYNVSGGPVGLGQSTARSMLVNLVVISTVSMIMANSFYANVLTEPIGT